MQLGIHSSYRRKQVNLNSTTICGITITLILKRCASRTLDNKHVTELPGPGSSEMFASFLVTLSLFLVNLNRAHPEENANFADDRCCPDHPHFSYPQNLSSSKIGQMESTFEPASSVFCRLYPHCQWCDLFGVSRP